MSEPGSFRLMICPLCEAQNDDTAECCVGCGTTLSVLTPGSLLASRYEIRDPLGRGGMGMVYKAHDRVLDEVVAIKTLRSEIAGTPQLARRFRSEIKLARRVRHPNVCAIHEYGEDRGFHFISMEYVDGVELRKLVRGQGGLAPDEAYRLAIQVADGLEAIHDAGIIHRDLKTANIMRDSHGQVRVMDFGIAKEAISEGVAEATLAGEIFGTPEYMSPEQVRAGRVDFRSDVYSLGIVVFEIFTGDVPFRGATPLATMFKQLEEWPSLATPSIPADLVPVLVWALAKDPAERYATAAAMAEALRQAGGVAGGRALEPASIALEEQRRVWEDALPALIEALGDEDPELRRSTAAVLGSMGALAKTAVPALLKAHEDADPTVAEAAAAAVKSISGAPASGPSTLSTVSLRGVSSLIEALRDKDPETRSAAAQALGALGPEARDALPALLKARTDTDPLVADAVRAALKSVSGVPLDTGRALREPQGERAAAPAPVPFPLPAVPSAVAELLPCLEASDPAVRRAGVEALGQLGEEAKEALPSLLRARKDKDASVAEAALTALAKIAATPNSVSALVQSVAAAEAAPRGRRGLPRPIPEFVLAFVKALLKTHYYSADHPSGRQAREGLYDLFRRALGRRRELTLLYSGHRAWHTTTRSEILVEVFGEEPLPLSQAVPPGAAELYQPRFTEFFTRHDLAGFSLREDLSAKEFESFVTLMADLSDTTVDDRSARFGERLAREGLQRISVIFRSDLVAEDRRVPWRVELALSRLRKDLRTIPLYHNLSEAEFRRLKFHIIDDCIRPNRHPPFIRDLMANADLIERELFAIKDLEVVEEVLAMLSPEMLVAVLGETAREVVRLADKGDRLPWEEALSGRLCQLLRKLGARAVHDNAEASARAFQEVFRRGLLEIADLPPQAREAVRRGALAEVLTERSDAFVSDLHRLKGTTAFPLLEPLAYLASERLLERLLEARRVNEGQRLVTLFREAGRSVEPRFSDRTLGHLADALRSGDREERESASALCVFAGAKSVPVLIDLLDEACRSDRTPLRKAACQALVLLSAASSEASRELQEALGRPEPTARFLQDVIDVLAEIGGEPPGRLTAFARHAESEVRIHALRALQRLIGLRAEAYLLGALNDPVVEVRRQALTSIGSLKPIPHRSLLRLLALADDRGEPDEVRIAALRALGGLGNERLPDGSSVEDFCLRMLEDRRGVMQRVIGRLVQSRSGKLRLASVQVLGLAGGERSLGAFRDLSAGADQELRKAIQEAARLIEARLAG